MLEYCFIEKNSTLVQKCTEMCRLCITLLDVIPHLASELAKKLTLLSTSAVFGKSGLVFNYLKP